MTHLVPLSAALGPLCDVYRHLLIPATLWQDERERRACGRGERVRCVDPDHFALICVAADAGPSRTVTPTRWTRRDVYDVLCRDIPNWCSVHRCPWPAELAEAMWDWFAFLRDTGRLDPASDPLGELRKPLQCYGGLDDRGRLRPDGAPLTVECECRLPYRETAQLLNRLGLLCEYRGQSPVDVLRALIDTGVRHPDREELEEMLRDLRDLRDDPPDAGDGGIPWFPHDDDGPPWS